MLVIVVLRLRLDYILPSQERFLVLATPQSLEDEILKATDNENGSSEDPLDPEDKLHKIVEADTIPNKLHMGIEKRAIF